MIELPFDEKLESHFTHLKDLSLPCKVICLMMEPFVIKMFSQMLCLFVCFLFLNMLLACHKKSHLTKSRI